MMNILNPSKLVSRSLIGAVGLSAIAFFGVPQSAEAANVFAGSDYWFTGTGTQFDFGGPIGIVNFNGIPNGPGGTDTQVTRLDNCVFAPAYPTLPSSCLTRLEMRNLSLASAAPVNVGGFLYDVTVGLNANNPSTGLMNITHNFLDDNTSAAEGTFSSALNVNFIANFTPTNGGANIGPISDTLNLTSRGYWSHDPLSGTPIVTGPEGDLNANTHIAPPALTPGFDDFYVVGGYFDGISHLNYVKEQHPGQGIHVVCLTNVPCPPVPDVPVVCPPGVPCPPPIPPEPPTIPEPSATLGLLFLGLSSVAGLKRKNKTQE